MRPSPLPRPNLNDLKLTWEQNSQNIALSLEKQHFKQILNSLLASGKNKRGLLKLYFFRPRKCSHRKLYQ